MKRINKHQLFKIILIIFLLIISFFIWFYTNSNTQLMSKSTIENKVDWTTVQQDPLKKPCINTNFNNCFSDTVTTGCFFLSMKCLGYNVNVKHFYLELFNETSMPNTVHEGQISPGMLEQQTLIYLKEQNLNISHKYINSTNYLLKVCENNYPVIVWINGENHTWIHATPYVIYAIDENYIYMTNIIEDIQMSPFQFSQCWTKDAIVYGKYW